MAERPLILASSSPWRRDLMARLGLPFEVLAPDFEEVRGGAPERLVRDNALGKARAVLARHPDACVIGADQVAVFEGEALGKPGSEAAAVAQLRRFRGRAVRFLTGVALVSQDEARYALDRTVVHFRADVSDLEIAAYVRRERPLACAGAFKAEGLGIALFASIESTDPTALIGLPLIPLCGWLRPLRSDQASS
ncbi:MAG: nucleoside triphosphate pyrophosphatase [Mariprofundaceae bacterium]